MSEGSIPDNSDAASMNKLRKALEATKRGAKSYASWSWKMSKQVDETLHTAEWGTYARQGYASVRDQVQAQLAAQRARAAACGSAATAGAAGDAPSAEDTAALDRYVHAVDWSAVSKAVTDQASDVAERARELVKDVDWERVTPVAKKVAIGLAIAVAVGAAAPLLPGAAPAIGGIIAGSQGSVAALAGAAAPIASFVDMNLANTMSSATAQSFLNIIGTSWA